MLNLTEILRRSAATWPAQTAQRYWDGTQWRGRSYRQLWELVQDTARGLKALGVQPGDRVGLMAHTRPEWVVADYAILCLDAVTVPIYPSATPGQVAHIIEDAGLEWVIVETPSLAEKTGHLNRCIVMDSRFEGRTFASLRSAGPELTPQNGRDDLATLVYTSGTTGLPKGAMLTHGNLLSNVESVVRISDGEPAMRIATDDMALSFLPLSHILERTGHNVLLHQGATIAYARSTDTLAEDLAELKPTLMIAVPRVFEKIYARIVSQVNGYSAAKRYLFQRAVEAGQKRYQFLSRGEPVPIVLERGADWYDRLVFKKVRQAVGGRLRYVIAGGAPLVPEIGRFFFAAGIPVLEGYGLTETAPVLSVNLPPVPRYGTVGRPLPGVDVAIADDGEILAHGPNVSAGYWNLSEATAESFRDGWFHTGDMGELTTDGFLRVTGRKKYIIVLSTGKNVAPEAVEQKLILSPLIEQAVVLGNGRKFVSALLYLDPAQLQHWIERNGKQALGTPILLKDPDLIAYVMGEVERATRDLAPFERPKRIGLLPRALSEEAGELTPSLKVKLAVVEHRYRSLIDSMYEGGQVPVGKDLAGGISAVMRTLLAVIAGVALAIIVRLVTR